MVEMVAAAEAEMRMVEMRMVETRWVGAAKAMATGSVEAATAVVMERVEAAMAT